MRDTQAENARALSMLVAGRCGTSPKLNRDAGEGLELALSSVRRHVSLLGRFDIAKIFELTHTSIVFNMPRPLRILSQVTGKGSKIYAPGK